MNIKIVDTTLRDGEQKAGVALSLRDKVEIAKVLNAMEIYQIEAGIPAMGGEEKKSICEIVSLGLNSKISSWNRMSTVDIDHSIDCNVDIIHISVPASELQIKSKLGKDKSWVMNKLKKCVDYAMNKGYEVTVGLEDATRAEMDFLIQLCRTVYDLGVKRVRYADTIGIMYPRKIFYEVKKIREEVPVEIEMHGHNDFGMAVANSIAAIDGGANFIDCTITGIGERAGNCNYVNFLKVLNEFNGVKLYSGELNYLISLEQSVKCIIKYGKV